MHYKMRWMIREQSADNGRPKKMQIRDEKAGSGRSLGLGRCLERAEDVFEALAASLCVLRDALHAPSLDALCQGAPGPARRLDLGRLVELGRVWLVGRGHVVDLLEHGQILRHAQVDCRQARVPRDRVNKRHLAHVCVGRPAQYLAIPSATAPRGREI